MSDNEIQDLNVRRTLNYIEDSTRQMLRGFINQPLTDDTRRRIAEQVQATLHQLEASNLVGGFDDVQVTTPEPGKPGKPGKPYVIKEWVVKRARVLQVEKTIQPEPEPVDPNVVTVDFKVQLIRPLEFTRITFTGDLAERLAADLDEGGELAEDITRIAEGGDHG